MLIFLITSIDQIIRNKYQEKKIERKKTRVTDAEAERGRVQLAHLAPVNYFYLKY